MKYFSLLIINLLITNVLIAQSNILRVSSNTLDTLKSPYTINTNFNILFGKELKSNVRFDLKINNNILLKDYKLEDIQEDFNENALIVIIRNNQEGTIQLSSSKKNHIKNKDKVAIYLHELKKELVFLIDFPQANENKDTSKVVNAPKTLDIDSLSNLLHIKSLNVIAPKIIQFNSGDNILSDAYLLNHPKTTDAEKENLLKLYNLALDSLTETRNIFLQQFKPKIGQIIHHSGLTQYKSNILKTDVTNFATGMSRFLVDRARAELNDAFFQRMYKEMDKMPELQALFPLSYAFLMQTNAHNMHMNLELLRVSFEEDIKLLPMNLYNIVGNMDVQAKYPFLQKVNIFLKESDLGLWVDLALFTVISNNGQINPKDLFSIFVHSTQFKQLEIKYKGEVADNTSELNPTIVNHTKLNLLNAIKLAELISNSLLSPESNRYWVSQEEINELFTNEALFKTYIGLLLAKSKFEDYNIRFYDAKGNAFLFADKVEQLYKTGEAGKQYLATLKQMVKDLYTTFAQVDEVGKKLKEANSSDELIEEAYKYYSVFKDNINAISNHLVHKNIVGDKLSLDNTIITNYVVPTIDMAYYIKAKKYNLAVNKLLLILQQAYNYNMSKQASGKEKNYKKSKEDKEFSKFINKFARYGVLIGTVAEAQTSDEVKAAIEASVLPVGSSRIKRHSRYSISLNAYVGAFYGQGFYKEEIGGILENKTVQTFGITAPIGVSFNMGSLGFRQKSALSLTMQVIDLGALVNFYAKNGDGASLPANTKIQLGDILAPGAQLSYSLGDSPFSLIAGVQYVPNLSRMTEISTNTNFTPIAYRAQFGLVIDIPLFNLKVWEK